MFGFNRKKNKQETCMRIVEKRIVLTRRGFIKGAGFSLSGAVALSGATLTGCHSDGYANEFKHLGADVGKVLLLMARDIFPHDKISDKFYFEAVIKYEEAAKKDSALFSMLISGVEDLDSFSIGAFKRKYIEIEKEAERVKVLSLVETHPLFNKLRSDLVVSLYNNKNIWQLFGYEGSSWDKGGYLTRGFNDIDWLNK